MRGRPLLFDTPEKLQEAIDKYIVTESRPTLAGLAYHLGIDRHTLYNYKERPDFFHIIKKATDYVEATYEERLIYQQNPTGVIFALKNMGWKDKQELDQKTEHSGGISIKWSDPDLSDTEDKGST
jgi:hypothetical protein